MKQVIEGKDRYEELLLQIITNQAIDAVVITEIKELLEEIVEKLDNQDRGWGPGYSIEN